MTMMTEETRSEVIHIRCSPTQKAKWEARAALDGMVLSVWLRDLADCAACDTLVLSNAKNGDTSADELLESVREDCKDHVAELMILLGELRRRQSGQFSSYEDVLVGSISAFYRTRERLSG